MGLDISYYRNLQRVNCDRWDECYPEHVRLDQNESFPGRAGSIVDSCYTVRGSEEAEPAGGFAAGSYGGYNEWRESLASLVGTSPRRVWQHPDRYAELPFVELINFSDCEGVIGPEASARLAKDFAEWDDRASESMDAWDYRMYRKWRAAFEAAADGGAVRFH